MADLNLTPARDATSFASSSTFPSHGNTNIYVYDVFINHQGTDGEKLLARHIYHRLSAYGLRVFLDQHELQQGDNMTAQVEGAIRTASVHVAIFTPTYAESSRCLDELVLMLESRSTIIPVFYKVEPSDLRWTRGGDRVYARSLGVLEKKKAVNPQTNQKETRYDSKTIEEWRNALSIVADISGFEVNAYNGDERQLVDEVVQQVCHKVRRPLHVARYPTGLEEKVKDVEITVSLQQHSGKPRIVGIVGLGGVGKTTLAKELFNREISHYDRCCFLLDVRSRSLHSLQSMFLKDLTQLNVQIDRVDEGIEKLKIHLSPSHRFLIVLDDVDHIDQLDALFSPVKDTIHPSSLILVTSRNKDVLTSSGIVASSIYTLKGLNRWHSEELFCMSAFGQPHPDIGFREMVTKFLTFCNGLPLFLRVLGALLHGKYDLSYWNAQLRKISKMLPSDIQSTLKISYDDLDEDEKQIFLDIACFFIGEDRNTAIRIWDGSGWEGFLGLRTLENRCLVEVDSKSCLRMHDHIRDLGRYLAENLECQLRLWRSTDNSLLPSDQPSVRGINTDVYNWLNPRELVDHLFAVTNMSRLQLLRGEGYHVESILRAGQSRVLTWLRWHNCPFPSLPSCITMNNLRVLQITGGSLETLWLHESQAPLELRELNVDAPLLKVPNSIGKLKHLEKFVLHQSNLETLPDEFCHVDSLIHVELKNCQKIRLLPDSVGNLTNLQSLDLSKCSNLEMLPYSLGNLRNLQHINLSKCSSLRMLPNFLDNLKHLRHMDLSGCSNLQILPNSLGNLKNLQHIDLSRCLNLQMLPNSFGNLTNLQHIELSGCSSLPILPNSFGNLIQLKHLCLRKCYDLTISSETLGQIRTLEWLEISGCYGIDVLPPQITHQRFLREMYLFCPFLKELPSAIGDLSHLEVLHLTSSCLELLEIGTLVSLEKLQTRDCVILKSIQGLAQLTKLRTLDVTNCPVLEELPGVEHLRSLKECGASGCPKQVQEQLETALSISRMYAT